VIVFRVIRLGLVTLVFVLLSTVPKPVDANNKLAKAPTTADVVAGIVETVPFFNKAESTDRGSSNVPVLRVKKELRIRFDAKRQVSPSPRGGVLRVDQDLRRFFKSEPR